MLSWNRIDLPVPIGVLHDTSVPTKVQVVLIVFDPKYAYRMFLLSAGPRLRHESVILPLPSVGMAPTSVNGLVIKGHS